MSLAKYNFDELYRSKSYCSQKCLFDEISIVEIYLGKISTTEINNIIAKILHKKEKLQFMRSPYVMKIIYIVYFFFYNFRNKSINFFNFSLCLGYQNDHF